MSKGKVVIIGAGAVGQSMAYLLKKSDYQILGFISKNMTSAQAGVELVEEGIAAVKYRKFVLEADLILITTPDRAIKRVAEELWNMNLIKEGACLIHCSGANSSKILFLDSINETKYGRVSIHPMQSVADAKQGVLTLANSFFSIEGNELGVDIAKAFMDGLELKYQTIATESKAIYHGAACIASNYLVSLIDLALQLNQGIGISREDALGALLDLMQGTLNNVESLGIPQALTGPIARGDVDTIKDHLDNLAQVLSEQELGLYQQLGLYTLGLAQEKGEIEQVQVEGLKRVLSGVKE